MILSLPVVGPKLAHFDFGEQPANFGDSISVVCSILSGDLPIDIEWLFNDYPINSYSGINVIKGGKKSSMLTIDSIIGRHAGNYTCSAKNAAASVSQFSELIVNGDFFKCFLIFFVVLFNPFP